MGYFYFVYVILFDFPINYNDPKVIYCSGKFASNMIIKYDNQI